MCAFSARDRLTPYIFAKGDYEEATSLFRRAAARRQARPWSRRRGRFARQPPALSAGRGRPAWPRSSGTAPRSPCLR